METRARKRQRTVHEIERSKEILATIPYEILYYMLTFVIITNEDAKNPWIVFPDWRPCIKVILANLYPTWDFKASYVHPIRFRPGMAFWSTALYDMIKGITFYGDKFLGRGDELEARVTIIKPNIIEIFDKVDAYKFAFRFKCPCTVWYKNDYFTLNKYYTHNSKNGFICIDQYQFGIMDSTDQKNCKYMSHHYFSTFTKGVPLILEEQGFDIQVSYESFSDLKNLINFITSSEDHFMHKKPYVLLYIVEGVLIFGGQKEGFTGGDGWCPVWNNKGLSMEDVLKLWPADEELESRCCYPEKCAFKAWIYHLDLIGPFDFVNLRINHNVVSRGNRIYSSVIKDGLSMCFEF